MSARVQISGTFLRRLRRQLGVVFRRLKPRENSAKANPRPSRYPSNERLFVPSQAHTKGHVFDTDLLKIADAAVAHQPQNDWGPEYDIIKEAFDPLFYLSHNDDIRTQELDPIGHYLRAGAREGRDPAPWFSTAEYRRAYLEKGRVGQRDAPNPFYHYLTVGRAAGHAPRAPANFEIFCDSLRMSPAQTSDLVTRRMADVRERLRHGELGEMAMKAAQLDPLIAQSWKAALKVRVPPASNAIGVRRIGHLISLQDQANNQRARAVIIMDRAQFEGADIGVNHILDTVLAGAGVGETVIILVDGASCRQDFPSELRIVDFRSAMPRTKGYQAGRTLIEFVRSLRPEVVVNLNAPLMNRALQAQGRAVAASSVVYCYLPQNVATPKSRATLGSKYYRAIDLHQRVIVSTPEARAHLAHAFALPKENTSQIWVAQNVPDQCAFGFENRVGDNHAGH